MYLNVTKKFIEEFKKDDNSLIDVDLNKVNFVSGLK